MARLWPRPFAPACFGGFMSFVSYAALAVAVLATPAYAGDEDQRTIIVNAQATAIATPAASTASVDAATIAAQVNAVSVEDTLKYLPSLIIRKRHIGDNYAPIATRTSGLGSSARSLIYADGALLSALIGNNNGNGSPRWSLVTPAEIERVDVIYGPFSAAYAGNSIGTVVNITTRMPDHLEARLSAQTNIQTYSYYGTDQTLPTTQFFGSLGQRFGRFSALLSATRTTANSQPVSFITATGGTAGYADVNRTGAAIRVLGAGGIEHHVQDTYKAKFAFDLTPDVQARYVLGIWRDDTQGTVQTYTQSYTTAFNSALYTRDALHLSHALSLTGRDWQVIGTLYRYERDAQNNPSPDASSGVASTGFIATRNDLPGAFTGGAGTMARQDGTGWATLDARIARNWGAGQRISIGAHFDRTTLNAATYSIANWLDNSSAVGQLRSASRGNTRTFALWAQDEIRLASGVKLTLGGRQEWWRAYGGVNTTLSSTINATLVQPERSFAGFSPKAALEYRLASQWNARLSAGQAFRMPTVGELYQTVTTGTLLANPNPGLLPERARSLELALEHKALHGSARIALFNEVVDNALISQLNSATNTTYVQNVERTRARGVEIAAERRDILGAFDLQASLTHAAAITSRNSILPSAQGKLLPSVPRWKASAVVTWHPTPRFSLSAAARYSSRNYATLDNSDIIGNTYQGFDKYFVIDLRALFRVTDHFEASLGVDNLNNDKYFLFHPFPQRSFAAGVNWRM